MLDARCVGLYVCHKRTRAIDDTRIGHPRPLRINLPRGRHASHSSSFAAHHLPFLDRFPFYKVYGRSISRSGRQGQIHDEGQLVRGV